VVEVDARQRLDRTCGLLCEGRLPRPETSITARTGKADTEKSSYFVHLGRRAPAGELRASRCDEPAATGGKTPHGVRCLSSFHE